MAPTLAIRPSKDLRTNYNEISKLCREQPVAVTLNGKEDLVVVAHEDYVQVQAEINQMKGALAVFEALAQAEDDIKLGRIMSADEAHAKLKARYN